METRATKQVCFHYLYILSFSLVNSVFLPHPCLLTVKNRTDKSALNENGGGGGGNNDSDDDQGKSRTGNPKGGGNGKDTGRRIKRNGCITAPFPSPLSLTYMLIIALLYISIALFLSFYSRCLFTVKCIQVRSS